MLNSSLLPRRTTVLRVLAGLGLSTLAFFPGRALAVVDETTPNMFLSPTAVPEQIYSPITVSLNGSTVFTPSMVAGGTSLTDVAIIPVLDPDLNTADGSWTNSDLTSLNNGNYTSYLEEQPNTDYFTTDPSATSGASSTATFNASGQYFVQLQTNAGNGIFEINVDNDANADDGAPLAGGVQRKITAPANAGKNPDATTTTVTVISDTTGDNGAMSNAATQLPNAVVVSTVADVVAAAKAAWMANGNKKIELNLVGHGRPGSIKIGSQRINDQGDQNGGMGIAAFQNAIDPYVKSVHFFSCSTGQGASGMAMLNTLASSIQGGDGITAYDDVVTISKTYFDTTATAKFITVLPEPASMGLLLCGLPLLLKRRRAA